MKSPTKYKLVYSVFFILFTLSTAFFIFADKIFRYFVDVNYFFLAIAIFLFLSPQGKIRLAESQESKPVYTLLQWFKKIVLAEIAIGLIFFSFAHTALTYIPAPTDLIRADLISMPALIAILSISIGYLYYREKQLPVLASFVPQFQNENIHLAAKRIVHIFYGAAFHFMLGLTITFGALQITHFFSTPVYGIQLITVVVIIILFQILGSRKSSQVIRFLCRRHLSVGGFLLGILLLLSIVLITGNLVAYLLNQTWRLPVVIIPSSAIQWDIVCWGFWLIWTPIISSFITRISYGRSIREIIVGVFLLPLIICALPTLHFTVPDVLLDCLALSGPILVIIFLWNMHHSSYGIAGFLPIPSNKIIRPRRTIKFIKPLLYSVLYTCTLYVCFGLKLISWGAVIGGLPCLLMFLGICFTVIVKAHANPSLG